MQVSCQIIKEETFFLFENKAGSLVEELSKKQHLSSPPGNGHIHRDGTEQKHHHHQFGLVRNMKRRICCFLIVTLHIITRYSTTSRPFSSQDVVLPQQDQIPQFTPVAHDPKQGLKSMEGNVANYRALSRLGSRPPNCQQKCEGCIPCDAIQIPATTDSIGVHYANYEPEDWKCKCGTAFFNP